MAKRKSRSLDGHVLPVTVSKRSLAPTPCSCRLPRRVLRLLAVAVILFVFTVLFILPYDRPSPPDLSIPLDHLPPLYQDIRAHESNLSHYDTYEKNKSIKYFWAAQHAHSSGWGNVMQDYVMMALLARATSRSFVFDDYMETSNTANYSQFNGKTIPSRIPLSALLGGPIVGASMLPGDSTPRSVNKAFFERVCPNPTVIYVSDVNTDDMRFNNLVPTTDVFNTWVDAINAIDDPCLMLAGNQVFEYWFFGEKSRMLPFWPMISRSPVLTTWDWSPLVHDAYRRNRHVFKRFPHRSSRLVPLLDTLGLSGSDDPSSVIKGLMAIHVRRGDFEEHCTNLANWGADWHAWNSFPEFIDKFEKPTDLTPDQVVDLYVKHCYPDIQQIVDRVRTVRQESSSSHSRHHLDYLYIMTNGPVAWVEELKHALIDDAEKWGNRKWESVMSSRDLELTWREKFVSQGVDMFVAQKAEVIIGNGWSSLTSNVVMLRMANGFPTDSIRFW